MSNTFFNSQWRPFLDNLILQIFVQYRSKELNTQTKQFYIYYMESYLLGFYETSITVYFHIEWGVRTYTYPLLY